YARRLSERQALVRRGARPAAGAGRARNRQVRQGTVRRGGAEEYVRAAGEGIGGAELSLVVIACDKRDAFAQGSAATKQSHSIPELRDGLLRCARNDAEMTRP